MKKQNTVFDLPNRLLLLFKSGTYSPVPPPPPTTGFLILRSGGYLLLRSGGKIKLR